MIDSINVWLQTYLSEVILIVLALQLLLAMLWIVTGVRLARQKRTLRRLSGKLGEGDRLKTLLESEHIDGDQVISHLRGMHEALAQMKGQIGLIRYNAIGERATDMSFSLAILDKKKDGVVISSLFSNQGQSYIYAKPVENGHSSYRLSKEEERAIEQALQPTADSPTD